MYCDAKNVKFLNFSLKDTCKMQVTAMHIGQGQFSLSRFGHIRSTAIAALCYLYFLSNVLCTIFGKCDIKRRTTVCCSQCGFYLTIFWLHICMIGFTVLIFVLRLTHYTFVSLDSRIIESCCVSVRLL